MLDVHPTTVSEPRPPAAPVVEPEEKKDSTIAISTELAKLLGFEDIYYDKLSQSKDAMDEVSADVFLLVNLMRMLRRAMDDQSGDKLTLGFLEEKMDQFNALADKLYDKYPGLFTPDDNPFKDINLNRVNRSVVEGGLAFIQNVQTKRQSEMQTHMGNIERDTMEFKMIMEIMQQMFKLVRESYGYWVRKQVS